MLKQKQQDLFAMIDETQSVNQVGKRSKESTRDAQQQQQQQQLKWLQEQRSQLYHEAGIMTKSLYRCCLRCVNLIRHGNEHDMADFDAREEEQKKNRLKKEGLNAASFAFELPVDRENELASRASYYHAFAHESFHQETDCLHANPWREENVTRFLYLIRQGEERRKWLLEEYKFKDPYPHKWDEGKLIDWEERAKKLIKETYETNGWSSHQGESISQDDEDAKHDDGIDWGDDDDDDNHHDEKK